MKGKSMQSRYLIGMMIMAAALLLPAPACGTTATWPTITSVTADADWTAPLGSVRLTCSASNPDGGDLNYEWSASGGSITGTGETVNWTAPQQIGMYDITVEVTNAQRARDTETITLIVSDGPPPEIRSLAITPRGHKYLREIATGYRVAQTYEYAIKCVASSPEGEIVYEWSCVKGQISEISEDGSSIIWTAPETSRSATVTVKVLDGAGNWVVRTMVFQVVSCEGCYVW